MIHIFMIDNGEILRDLQISPNGFEKNFIEEYPSPYKSINNRFNICYLGGITKNRGIDILVQACVELHEKYPYMKLDLIGFYGEGTSKDLKELIEIGKDGSILYVDYDVEDFKRKIEFLINNPQIREEMSKKLIEMRSEYLWDKRSLDLYEAIKPLE